MADLSISAADCIQATGGKPSRGTLGVAGTAGQLVYVDTNNLLQLAKADTAIHANCVGVLVSSGGAGQPAYYLGSGTVTIGGTMTLGETYYISQNNAGGIMPHSDITTGNYVKVFGLALTTTVMLIINSGGNPVTQHV